MFFERFFSICGAFALGVALWACADDQTAGTSEESEGIVAIKDREIAGVTQKGPFLTGASVTIQELDGLTLVQTGKSFRASIKNNRGDFVIKGVNLASQYALLEVEGYYRNEVSGERSKGVIALNALTDLSDRNHVNVNVLTHLMADRILALKQKNEMRFADARKQAEAEVLTSFGVLENVGDAEDLELFTGDGGALLLAISVLMQGDGSEADLSERIAHAATAFAENGAWEGSEKTEIADWAFQVYAGLITAKNGDSILPKIRNNVESWNIADSVPDFEDYIYKFWANDYGLGTCNENNVYEVKLNSNALSLYHDVEFTCNPSGRWSLVRMREIPDGLYENVQMKGAYGGNQYKVISIGNMQWFAENLREKISTYSSGISRRYGDDERNYDSYGELYGYNLAKTACPEGYDLPSVSDVYNLLDMYGGEGKDAAQALLSANGFGAVYGGMMGTNGYQGIHESALFLTTSSGCVLRIDSLGARVECFDFSQRIVEASVRCIKKDKDADYYSGTVITDSRDGGRYYTKAFDGRFWITGDLQYVGNPANASCNVINGWCYYSWEQAQNACPEGWHLPDRKEWIALLGSGRISSTSVDELGRLSMFYIVVKLNFLRGNKGYFELKNDGSYSWENRRTGFWVRDDSLSASGTVIVEDGNFSYKFRTADKRDYFTVRCVKN